MRPYLFPWPRYNAGGQLQETRLVAFVPQSDFEARNLSAFIADEQQRNPIYSSVLLLGFRYNDPHLSTAIAAVRERLPITSREMAGEDRLQHWSIHADGHIKIGGVQLDSGETHRLFEAGALTLFCADDRVPPRSPLLVAPMGFHFIKPSKTEHTTHFIRAAEVLTEKSGVEFLAASLLRYLREDTQAVHCDTSSITVLGFALEALFSRFASAGVGFHRQLSVDSFGSWDGIRLDPAQPGGMVFDPKALYIISASTGGRLAQEMERQQFDPSRIVTIFHHGAASPIGAAICHIPPDQKVRAGTTLADIQNFPANGCKLCALGSTTLELSGDQFLPTTADIRTLSLKLEDRPEWLPRFMGSALGTGAIRAHHGVGKRSHTHEIFICLGHLYDANSGFTKKLDQAIRQSIPFSADRVYLCDDSGAEAIAQKAASEMEGRGPRPQLISVRDLKRNYHSLRRSGGSCVVVAGCVCSGRSLIEINSILRDVEVDGAVAFLLGLRRTRNAHEQSHLQSTLTFASGRLPFALHCVEDIFLPDNTAERDSIWLLEEHLLSQMLTTASYSEFPTELIETRLRTLQEARGETQRGLTTHLFWPSSAGEGLRLRTNFSLFKIPSGQETTQAELFFTMSAMLHKLRLAEPNARRLVSNEHQRTLLHPDTFRRFSDGVLQASLLRACLRSELDYEICPSVEAEAIGVLEDVFSNAGGSGGEAASEFLLALALKRMRLSPAGLSQVVEVAKSQFEDPLTVEFHLARHISQNY